MKELKRNKFSLFLLTVLVVSVFIAGCGSPKDANKDNFKKAVQNALEEDYFEYCIGRDEYPYVEPSTEDALVNIGFLEILEAKPGLFYGSYKYDLTEEGKKNHTPGKGFCYGEPRVTMILGWSEPSSYGPYIVSEVEYEYKLVNVKDWAKQLVKNNINPFGGIVGGDNFKRFKRNVSGEVIKQEAVLILKDSGWVVD